ncbi:MAG: nucleotide exchange factor GrpE [Pseudonocardiaceae bacterium]
MRPADGPDNPVAEPEPQLGEQLATPVDRPEGNNGRGPGELVAVPWTDAAPELARRLAGMEAVLRDVTQRLAGESDRALARERVIDRQHEEIERLRSIERAGQLRPMVTDLGRLRNGLLRQAGTVPTQMTGSQVANLLESFAATVEETLERCGIAVLPCEVGVAFAPNNHQVVGVAEINDPEHDATVAEVIQDGYAEIDGGRVVVPARIRLHRYMTKENADG